MAASATRWRRTTTSRPRCGEGDRVGAPSAEEGGAIALGADIAIAPEAGHAVAEVLAATAGWGADVVIEASGSASGCTEAVRMLSVGGRLLVHGAPPAELHLPVSLRAIFAQELTVVGTFGGTDDTWPRAIDMISTGRLDPTALVDAEWPLSDAPAGLAELLRNRGLVKGQVHVPAE